MKISFLKSKEGKKKALAALFVASFILAVAMMVVFINSLATKFEWYLYTSRKYEHSIGEASDYVFNALDKGKGVDIYFCMSKEDISATSAYSLVYKTAQQMADKYEFISNPKILNTFMPSDSAKIDEFASNPDGSLNDISKESVIFDCDGKFRVVTLSDFFDLDTSGTITAYRGEEVMSALVSYVARDENPKVAFTSSHGESSTEALLKLFVCSGYDLAANGSGVINLSTDDIEEGTEFIVISAPVYDFEKAAEGSLVKSEIEKLDAFVSAGGNLLVIKDPYTAKLPNLEGLLEKYGMKIKYGIVFDTKDSITADGRTLGTELAESDTAKNIAERISGVGNDRDTVVSTSSAIEIVDSGDFCTDKLLISHEGAKLDYFDGTRESGQFTLAAVSYDPSYDTGHSVTLFTGTKTFSSSLVNTDSYANRDCLYSLIEDRGSVKTPVGSSILQYESRYLEGLTVTTSRIYATVLIGIIPMTVALVGVFVYLKRRRR
ncbi:MAG: Gldg family protein [Eubacteriales bacterium]|nr:Gldg family protein [Eubacteriales bacterium]